jgi:hypothetical protein
MYFELVCFFLFLYQLSLNFYQKYLKVQEDELTSINFSVTQVTMITRIVAMTLRTVLAPAKSQRPHPFGKA